MKTRSTYALFAVLLLVTLMASSSALAAFGWNSSNWGMNRSKNTTLSVFAATDRQSEESGFGIALTQYQNEVSDLSFTNLDSFRLFQFSKLAPKQIGPIMANFGFTVAYADPTDDVPAVGTPSDFLTGLSAILAKSQMGMGLSFDIRASSLSKDFDPIAWFTDPDVFTIGAGLSYSF